MSEARLLAAASPAGLAFVCGHDYELPEHVRWINEELTKLAYSRGVRLGVFMPPRHGKSELISKWLPAWYLGNFPTRNVMVITYAETLACDWTRHARDVLVEHGHIFGVSVRGGYNAKQAGWQTSAGGYCWAFGVGGPIAGRGADLMILDDLVKNAEEADSELVRDKTWEWLETVAFTRLEPGASLVLVMTRWHDDDVAGRLEERDGFDRLRRTA